MGAVYPGALAARTFTCEWGRLQRSGTQPTGTAGTDEGACSWWRICAEQGTAPAGEGHLALARQDRRHCRPVTPTQPAPLAMWHRRQRPPPASACRNAAQPQTDTLMLYRRPAPRRAGPAPGAPRPAQPAPLDLAWTPAGAAGLQRSAIGPQAQPASLHQGASAGTSAWDQSLRPMSSTTSKDCLPPDRCPRITPALTYIPACSAATYPPPCWPQPTGGRGASR